jgi:hypothetical protein
MPTKIIEAVPAWMGSNKRARAKSKKLRMKNKGEIIPPVEKTNSMDITVRIIVEGRLPFDDILLVRISLKAK